jgi:1-deoxy-D-xylulose-5-phosphate synthase
MGILDSIQGPADVKALEPEQLTQLCSEIRALLVQTLSRTGGHLASNLGAVELTVAIHRVYDTEKDRLVFDVGHQCYTHKLLTGRAAGFANLRSTGGVSGFPKPEESVHDAFIAGHASNSISVALGMARARTALGGDYDVLALIGDGALNGGMAFEALSDAGKSGEPLVIILNDNGMSINPMEGGLADMLARMRTRPGYIAFKRWYRRVLGEKAPGLYKLLHRAKMWLKDRILPDNMFDDFGFEYIGPVDGHDLTRLESVIRWAREQRKPCLVHVITKKGHGYPPAENAPEAYHSIGAFDPATGVPKYTGEDFSAVFGRTLTALAKRDNRVVAITAAMMEGTGLIGFQETFPERFFDVGIAEEHACAMAAGMAKQGLIPVFAVYSTFLQRSYDMLIHDISLQGLHVVLAVDRAGIVGRDGQTHQGSFDVAFLSTVPGMKIYSPASFAELRSMLRRAVLEDTGPVAVRYPRGGEIGYKGDISDSSAAVLREGTDVTVVVYGIETGQGLNAAELLAQQGVSAEVIKLSVLSPLDPAKVLASAKKTGILVVPEETCADGCIGERLLAAAAENGVPLRASRMINLGSGILPHGTPEELRRLCGLDSLGIANAVLEICHAKTKT